MCLWRLALVGTFKLFSVPSGWALIPCWALSRINTIKMDVQKLSDMELMKFYKSNLETLSNRSLKRCVRIIFIS